MVREARDYFTRLNYSMANEDTRLELAILPEGSEHVCAIAGSGGRVMPLLARGPRQVTVVDLVDEQLLMTELRIEALRNLSHEEYLGFWGYPPTSITPSERRALFSKLQTLSVEAKGLWGETLEANEWNSLLFLGGWERTFIKLSRITRLFTGRAGAGLFEARTMEEQARYLEESFPHRRWHLAVRIFANARVFNALLYKGSFPEKNFAGSFFSFYRARFEKLLRQAPARESFFLQLVFFGKLLHPEGNTIEADAEVFARAKAALERAEVRYARVDITDLETELTSPISFLSFSNVASYFTGEQERTFLTRIRPKLAPGGMVVLRHYIHFPQAETSGFRDVTDRYRDAIDAEKVGVFDPQVFERVD